MHDPLPPSRVPSRGVNGDRTYVRLLAAFVKQHDPHTLRALKMCADLVLEREERAALQRDLARLGIRISTL